MPQYQASPPKQIRLAINLLASGRHNASWKTINDPAGLSTDIDVFTEIAQTAERGLLDGIFLADNCAGLTPEAYQRPWRALFPGVLLASLAARTSRIGLVLTAPALYGDPATLAREIASLDLVSRGRGAWNIITRQHEHSLRMLGAGAELPRSAKYDKADEFVTVVTQLWQSLPPAAITADAARSASAGAGAGRSSSRATTTGPTACSASSAATGDSKADLDDQLDLEPPEERARHPPGGAGDRPRATAGAALRQASAVRSGVPGRRDR